MLALILVVLLAVAIGAGLACWTVHERVEKEERRRGEIDTTRRRKP